MAKPTAQQCHAMTTYFVNFYEEVHGRKPIVNRNKARYGFEGILMDYSPDKTKEIIRYYVYSYADNGLDWLFYNYEKVVAELQREEEEKKASRIRRQKTEERLAEWRNRWQR